MTLKQRLINILELELKNQGRLPKDEFITDFETVFEYVSGDEFKDFLVVKTLNGEYAWSIDDTII